MLRLILPASFLLVVLSLSATGHAGPAPAEAPPPVLDSPAAVPELPPPQTAPGTDGDPLDNLEPPAVLVPDPAAPEAEPAPEPPPQPEAPPPALDWGEVNVAIDSALAQAAGCLNAGDVPPGVKLRLRVSPDGRLALVGSSPAIGPQALRCLKWALAQVDVPTFQGPPLIVDRDLEPEPAAAPPPPRYRRYRLPRPNWLSETRPPLVAFELATAVSMGFCLQNGNADCDYGKLGVGFDLAPMLRVLYFAAGLDVMAIPLTAGRQGSGWDTINTFVGARLRFSYLFRRLEPFVDLHAGYAWYSTSDQFDASVVKEGPYFGTSLGLQYRLSRTLFIGGHFRFLTPWLHTQCTSPGDSCQHDGDFGRIEVDGEHILEFGFSAGIRLY